MLLDRTITTFFVPSAASIAAFVVLALATTRPEAARACAA